MTRPAIAGAGMLVLLATAGTAAPPERSVIAEATRDGQAAHVEAPETLARAMVALVESASVASTAWVHPDRRWARDLEAPSRVHVTFVPGREVQVMDDGSHAWRRRTVDEILLVVPADAWPDHVLLRTEGTVLSVTKYSPCPLLRVATIPVPALSTVRYDGLREECASSSR
jgi:hypothetical protein